MERAMGRVEKNQFKSGHYKTYILFTGNDLSFVESIDQNRVLSIMLTKLARINFNHKSCIISIIQISFISPASR